MRKVNIGDRFDRLTVIEKDNDLSLKYKRAYWKCSCDCGNIISARSSHLFDGNIKSCKCLGWELTGKRGEEQSIHLTWKRAAIAIHYARYSDGDITLEDFLTLSQKNCHYCGIEPINRTKGLIRKKIVSDQEEIDRVYVYNGLDRIDSTQGHNMNNVIPCCYICNRAKSNHPYNEFKQWIAKVKKHLFTDGNIEKVKKLDE